MVEEEFPRPTGITVQGGTEYFRASLTIIDDCGHPLSSVQAPAPLDEVVGAYWKVSFAYHGRTPFMSAFHAIKLLTYVIYETRDDRQEFLNARARELLDAIITQTR